VESIKCSHISGKTADDCLECDFLKPGPLEGSGICKYPIKQIGLEPEKIEMNGAERIAAERKRQTEKEGWTAEHDCQWSKGEIIKAAICYLYPSDEKIDKWQKIFWPWGYQWWKPTPKNRIRDLEKAGALIAAEIDRLLQLENKA
jgi:hypothetical protein